VVQASAHTISFDHACDFVVSGQFFEVGGEDAAQANRPQLCNCHRTLPLTDDNSVHDNPQAATMSASLNKIAANSPSRQNPSELETQIATALHDLETNTADLKAALRPLQIVSAREVRTVR